MRIAAYIAGLFTLAAFGQQAPVFRAETAGITVDVIVTDRKGHHVAGLEAADFKVFEDGVEHAVRGFTAPVAAARKRGEAAVAGGSEAVRPPQLITLLIDLGDLHPENLKQACTAASRFAGKTIDAGNSIAIYWVDTALHLALPFSRDKQKAQDVLTRLGNRLPVGRFGARERERTEMEIDDLFVRAYPETLRGAEPTPRVNEGGSASRSGKRSSEDTLELMQQEAAFRELNMLRSWLTTASGATGEDGVRRAAGHGAGPPRHPRAQEPGGGLGRLPAHQRRRAADAGGDGRGQSRQRLHLCHQRAGAGAGTERRADGAARAHRPPRQGRLQQTGLHRALRRIEPVRLAADPWAPIPPATSKCWPDPPADS